MSELGPVLIGAREVYDAVVRLTGRVDVHIAQQSVRQDELARDVADHETRIRTVERRQWKLPSLATVLAGLSLVVSIWHLH